jgi:hypothetical protein
MARFADLGGTALSGSPLTTAYGSHPGRDGKAIAGQGSRIISLGSQASTSFVIRPCHAILLAATPQRTPPEVGDMMEDTSSRRRHGDNIQLIICVRQQMIYAEAPALPPAYIPRR